MSEMNREEDAISIGSSASTLSRIIDGSECGSGSNNNENDPPPAAAVNNSTTATAPTSTAATATKKSTAGTKRGKSSTTNRKKTNCTDVVPPHVSYQPTLLLPPTTALPHKPRDIASYLLKQRKKKKDITTREENERNHDNLINQAQSLQSEATAFCEGAMVVVQQYYVEATAAAAAFASLKSTIADEGSSASQVAILKARVENLLEQLLKETTASHKREANAMDKNLKALTDQIKTLVKEKDQLQAQLFSLN